MLERSGMRALLALLLAILAGGCATGTFERPTGFDDGALRARAEIATKEGLRVSAAVPSHDEIDAIFGFDLASKGIQPVWIEIENDTDRRLHFLRTGLDPEYFAPREVAFLFYGSLSDEGRRQLDEHLEGLDFENPVEPRSIVSGFVFTNQDRETKFVNIDLLSRGWSSHLSLLVPIPERSLSDDKLERIYSMMAEPRPIEIRQESELRERLERLPCCAASEDGVQAEPLNVVLIGKLGAAGPALVRRSFQYSPAPPLYAFGRPQDFSARKGSRWVAAQPHILRLWLTNLRFEGKLVWVGHISTPLGGRFADSADDDALPTIDPNVDDARNDLAQDAIFSQLLSEIGFVKGVGAVSASSPRTTPGGSSYYTDGLRAVMIFEGDPISMTEIELMSWERLAEE